MNQALQLAILLFHFFDIQLLGTFTVNNILRHDFEETVNSSLLRSLLSRKEHSRDAPCIGNGYEN